MELTCRNKSTITEPFDNHRRVSNWSNLSLEVSSLALVDIDIPEWTHEGGGRVASHRFLLLLVSGGTLHMLQIDHLRLSLFPVNS